MSEQDSCAPTEAKRSPSVAGSTPPIKSDPKSNPLSLDRFSNNCHPKGQNEGGEENDYCPHPVGHFRGVKNTIRSKYVGVRVNIACKRWQCPHCGPIRVKQLRKRIYNGAISQDYIEKGFRRSKYEQKFITLTAPGRSYRMTHTPEQAAREMNQNLHKLMRAIKKKHGFFMYLKVVEAHKDGFPHFHILAVGPGIAPKAVLDDLRDLWTHKYGMGNVDIRVIQRGIKAAIKYITAYITKDIKPIYRGARVFSSSRNALEPPPPKPVWQVSKFYMGLVRATKDNKAEVLEMEIWPDMPGGLEWWRVQEAFRGDIDAFFRRVIFDPVAVE